MRKIIGFMFVFLLFPAVAFAAPAVAEAPVKPPVPTPVTVTIDNSTLTKVPTSQTSGRMGVFFSVPSANTGDIVGFFGDCSSTALASTIRPLKFIKSSSSALIPIREDVCMWLITTHSAPESVHYQEALQ